MSAVNDTTDAVEALNETGYKYGFVTDIEADTAPKGLSEDIVRFISAKKDEPEWLTGMATEGLSPCGNSSMPKSPNGPRCQLSAASTTRMPTTIPRPRR